MNTQQIAEQLRNLANQIELTPEQHRAVDAALNEEIAATSKPGPQPFFIKPSTPAFQLPLPPPGMQWHRTDGWTAETLPQGYRPLVEGEVIQDSDETPCVTPSRWQKAKASVGKLVSSTMFWRTTRPLAFTHEGKIWTWHRPGDPCPCGEQEHVTVLYNNPVQEHIGTPCPAHRFAWKNLSGLTPIIGWRYTDEPKMVELGPDDVPPCSVIKTTLGIQALILRLKKESVYILGQSGTPYEIEFSELKDFWLINRSIPLTGRWNPNAWEPCHKPAP